MIRHLLFSKLLNVQVYFRSPIFKLTFIYHFKSKPPRNFLYFHFKLMNKIPEQDAFVNKTSYTIYRCMKILFCLCVPDRLFERTSEWSRRLDASQKIKKD